MCVLSARGGVNAVRYRATCCVVQRSGLTRDTRREPPRGVYLQNFISAKISNCHPRPPETVSETGG
eukprot:6650138-Prymnesium_polylepis.1